MAVSLKAFKRHTRYFVAIVPFSLDINMDCDYDESDSKLAAQQELIESTRGRKKGRGRKSRFAQAVEKSKPTFDPKLAKSYEDYLDEYYKLVRQRKDLSNVIDWVNQLFL